MKRFPALLISLTWALAACETPATRPDEREPSASSVGAAATWHVNSTTDAGDAHPGDGVCRTGAGSCTLRAAIQEANARPGADVITVPAGTYRITRPEPANGGIAGGDFNITAPVEITGAGAARTMVDGNHQPVVIFNILSGATGRVTLAELTVQNGGRFTDVHFAEGGGIGVASGATATLRKVTVSGNVGSGGNGIFNKGTLTVDRSTISGNGGVGAGGGIANDGAALVTRSTISGNSAEDGGGIFNAGRMTVANSTVSGNGVVISGGGVSNLGTLTLNNVTITANQSGDPEGRGSTGGTGGLANGDALDPTATVNLSNTIVAGNTAFADLVTRVPSDCSGTLTSAGYNLIGTTRNGAEACTIAGNRTGNKTGSPRLGPLQNNGGPTLTHALLKGSPAINTGNPAAPGTREPVCTQKDQRLLPRGATRCDIGSFEVQGPRPSTRGEV